MTLITQSQLDQLLANGKAQRAAIDNDQGAIDFKPVVKLFTPDAQCTWLLTELDPRPRTRLRPLRSRHGRTGTWLCVVDRTARRPRQAPTARRARRTLRRR